MNANQVFGWRQLYHAGRLGGVGQVQASNIKLLPVTVDSPGVVPSASVTTTTPATGAIHIKLSQAQIRIEGQADLALLRVILEALRG